MLNAPLTAQSADVYTDLNALSKLKNQARNDSPEALKKVAEQFEALFVNNVLKSMRQAKLADGIMDSEQSKFYSEMYDQQLSLHLSHKSKLGFSDLIVKQLSKKTDTGEKLAIEDYLNRATPSSTQLNEKPRVVERSLGNQSIRNFIDGGVEIQTYFQDNDPINQDITEIPLKNHHSMPIQSAADFVKHLHPLAQQAAKELGVEPKTLLAQAALETGWGQSLIKDGHGMMSFNLFNIKADKSWQGKQARVSTHEYEHGSSKKVTAGFRAYESFQESFDDYVDFIKSNPRYENALKRAGNSTQYLRELQKAGYATDPNYADKVMSIYQSSIMSAFSSESLMTRHK